MLLNRGQSCIRKGRKGIDGAQAFLFGANCREGALRSTTKRKGIAGEDGRGGLKHRRPFFGCRQFIAPLLSDAALPEQDHLWCGEAFLFGEKPSFLGTRSRTSLPFWVDGAPSNAALPFSEAVKCLLDFMALKGFIYVIRLVNNNYYVGCSGSTIAHRFHRHSVIRKKTFLYFDHIFFVKDIRVINVYDVEKRLHMALSQETGLDLGSIRNSGSIGFNCSNQALVRALFYTKINEEAFLMPSLKVIGELSDFVKKSM